MEVWLCVSICGQVTVRCRLDRGVISPSVVCNPLSSPPKSSIDPVSVIIPSSFCWIISLACIALSRGIVEINPFVRSGRVKGVESSLTVESTSESPSMATALPRGVRGRRSSGSGGY